MPDWEAYVRKRLELQDFQPETEIRILRETAIQLEDFYRDAVSGGMSEAEAEAYAKQQIEDWDDFAKRVRCSAGFAARSRIDGWTDRAGSRATGSRAVWWAVSDLATDAVRALRGFRRQPTFSVIVAMTLALGIGATTAIFAVVHNVVLNPLPYRESDRLVRLWHTAPGANISRLGISWGNFYHYRELNRVFDDITSYYSYYPVTLTREDDPATRLISSGVTASFFPLLLQRPPHLGRVINEADSRIGAEQVVVISHRLWRDRFGQDPEIIGQNLQLDGASHRVIGVAPSSFDFPSTECDAWWPVQLDPSRLRLGGYNSAAVARLKEGVSASEAQADLRSLVPRLSERFPGPVFDMVVTRGRLDPQVTPLLEDRVGNVKRRLWLLLGAVGFVMLIACANVANLFLVRAERRRREMAVRAALGAGRMRLLRYVVTESALLAALGGVGGILIAAIGVQLLVRWGPETLPRLHEVAITGPVVLFAASLSLVSGLILGTLPAPGSRLSAMNPALKDDSRGSTSGRSRVRVLNALAVSEVALAVILLIGAGLMVRSLWNLQTVDPGFTPDGVLALHLSLSDQDYADVDKVLSFQEEIRGHLAALPGVQSVGAVTCLPLRGCTNINPLYEEGVSMEPDEIPPAVLIREALPGYFETMSIPLLSGRLPTRSDLERNTGAAVVSRTLAERFWPGESPVGRRVYPDLPHKEATWFTIVGVVGDVLTRGLAQGPSDLIYLPIATPDGRKVARSLVFVVKGGGSPMGLAEPVRDAIWKLDDSLPIVDIRALEEVVAEAEAPAAFAMTLLMIAASVALALGVIGVYAVLSFRVSQRTGEIGIRMALGAGRRDVRRMILGEGIGFAILGSLLGLGGALALTRFMSAMLYGVDPIDPATYAGVTVALTLVAGLASYLPARRAASVDPIQALRSE